MSSPTVIQSEFQDGQIIYLQHETTRLYAETIQIIEPRQLCWARPLALIQLPNERDMNFYRPLIFHDLRQGSDLLLPIALFHIALDVDAIPVIAQLDMPKDDLFTEPLANSGQSSLLHLQNFVYQVWQAHSEQFSK